MQRLLLLVLTLLLSSCFDVREEITVHADGSGRLVFDYAVPKEAMLVIGGESGIRRELAKLLDHEPKVRVDTLEVTNADGEARIHIDIVADSMLALMDLKQSEAFESLPASSREMAGDFDVRLDGLEVRVNRHIDIAGALGFAALGIGRQDRETRRLEYIIHLPKPASDHNADRSEDGGRTLVWQRSLGQALQAPVDTRFTAPIPLPGWVIAAALALVLAIGSGVVMLVRRLRRSLRRGPEGPPSC